MTKASAGILLYRRAPAAPGGAEVLLVHPGGPYYARRDDGVWSVPKGEAGPGEDDLLAVARREFGEETGADPLALAAPGSAPVPLGSVKQRGHKVVTVWALEGDWDPSALRSNEFEAEWPPRSGRRARFPEVDRAAWFDLDTARRKLVEGQRRFVDELAALLAGGRRP